MRSSKARTRLVAVLFTDIVRSTEIAEEVGDRRWRALVAAHHRLVRRELRRHRGRELDTAGDGFFAVFDRPATAIRCAFEVSERVRELGLEIRAGLHLGEAEVMGPKVGGVAVNTAARIVGLGKAGEILASSTVRDAVAGKGIDFVDHGIHQLKGLDGEFRLFDVTAVDGVARGLPLDPAEARGRRDALPEVSRPGPRWLVPVGAVVLLAAGVAVALALGGADEQPAATGSEPSGRPLGEGDEQVIGLVPQAFSDSCAASDPLPAGAVGSVTCSDGETAVRYDTYATGEALEGAFAAATAGVDLLPGSCADDPAASGFYAIDGSQRGAVVCFVDHPAPLEYVATIVWTDDDLRVMGRASLEIVTQFPGNVPDLSLYEWWRSSAGPGPGGVFREKDDPADLLSGTFRTVIRQEQVGPTNEGGADVRWVGRWTITLDGDLFVEEFEGVYREESELLWGKGDRLVLRRSYQFPPLGGVTEACQRYESLVWDLDGDTLVFSDPSPEPECQAFRRLASFQPWERID